MEVRSFSGIKTKRFRWLYLNRRTINEGDEFFIEDGDVIFEKPPQKHINVSSQLQYKRDIGDRSIIHDKKWNRLRKLNNWLDKKEALKYNMEIHFDRLFSYFDIPLNIKSFIKKEVMDLNPETLHDVVKYSFKSIVINNFNITTLEFRKTIKKIFQIGKNTFKELWSTKRDYTWYINKVLSNLDLTPDLHHKLYTKVKDNFDKLEGIIPGFPTTLISFLCRLSYKALGLKENMPKLEEFLISNHTYSTYRKIFKERGIKLPKGNRRRN